MKSIDRLLEDCFAMLSPKQRRVVTGRFGLKGGSKATLQEIGDELGVTRERVRQIEAQTMKKLAPMVRAEAASFVEAAAKHLVGVGGVRRDDNFMEDLRATLLKSDRDVKNLSEKVRFILLAAGEPRDRKSVV